MEKALTLTKAATTLKLKAGKCLSGGYYHPHPPAPVVYVVRTLSHFGAMNIVDIMTTIPVSGVYLIQCFLPQQVVRQRHAPFKGGVFPIAHRTSAQLISHVV